MRSAGYSQESSKLNGSPTHDQSAAKNGKAAPPLPIGAVLEIPEFNGHNTQRFRIDGVDLETGNVRMSDITEGHTPGTVTASIGIVQNKIADAEKASTAPK